MKKPKSKPKLIFLNHSDTFNISPVIALLLTSFAKNGYLIQALNGKQLIDNIVPWADSKEMAVAKLDLLAEYLIADCNLVITNYINSVEEISELHTQLLSFGSKKGLLAFYDVCFVQLRDFSDEIKHADAIQMDIANHYAAQVFSSSVVGRAYTYLTPQACLIDILALLAKMDQKVAIAGKSISGKGTITEMFEKELGYAIFSCGTHVTRVLAEEKGVTIEELVASYGKDKVGRAAYDKLTDGRLLKELKEKTRSSFEGRMTGHFAKKVSEKIFRIYMKVSPENAAKRLFLIPPGERKASYNFPSEAAAAVGIEKRNREDMKAYLRTYKYNYTDENNYHAVIDTNKLSKRQMFPEVLKQYISFLISNI